MKASITIFMPKLYADGGGVSLVTLDQTVTKVEPFFEPKAAEFRW